MLAIAVSFLSAINSVVQQQPPSPLPPPAPACPRLPPPPHRCHPLQIITGVVLGTEFGKYGNVLPNDVAIGVLVVICVFVAGFAWSWGECASRHGPICASWCRAAEAFAVYCAVAAVAALVLPLSHLFACLPALACRPPGLAGAF